MMKKLTIKIIGGKMCVYDVPSQSWMLASASVLFRVGAGFQDHSNFPPIKFS